MKVTETPKIEPTTTTLIDIPVGGMFFYRDASGEHLAVRLGSARVGPNDEYVSASFRPLSPGGYPLVQQAPGSMQAVRVEVLEINVRRIS